mmetsp:Transcript_22991/g.26275  ORF Transcript_22991/g.26275 Transcript_22991/m.26275 type:complete len:86 (+) Transcript_22991:163-420(+)
MIVVVTQRSKRLIIIGIRKQVLVLIISDAYRTCIAGIIICGEGGDGRNRKKKYNHQSDNDEFKNNFDDKLCMIALRSIFIRREVH